MQLLGNVFQDVKDPYYIEEDELNQRLKELYCQKREG
jgi:hypothetical protein